MIGAGQIIKTADELKAWHARSKPGPVGLVPTMGALHEGHLTLVREARKACKTVVVSIFVNPMQFGPNEDFSKYPRTWETDLKACSAAGVDAIFHPQVELMYPAGQKDQTRVTPPPALIKGLCGAFRPGHFEGVATVVAKLFNLLRPDRAFFGEKDYQQLQVIKKLVADLNMNVEVVPVPIVRDADGLALSSRNVYLSADQREMAPRLYEALKDLQTEVKNGTSLTCALKNAKEKISNLAGVQLQYLEAVHPETLAPLAAAEYPMVVLVAAKYGDVRLIDNLIISG